MTKRKRTKRSSSVSIKPKGDTTIGGSVAGRDISITHNTVINYDKPKIDDQRRLRLTVHKATFIDNGLECYFINATNLSDREVEVTHIWFECDSQIPVMQLERPLPKRLRPDETWETWTAVSSLPPSCSEPYTLARARLSTGLVVESQKNENVPLQGFVPGGSSFGRGSSGSRAS
jgi:hypothetical protein